MKSKNKIKVCVVGLGYVGLPLAVAFAKKYKVYGYDINKVRIRELQEGKDRNNEIDKEAIQSNNFIPTNDPSVIKDCNFIIIAVPTPVTKEKQPDLSPVKSATATVAKHLSPNSIVILESTFYPGVTEEICVPILEKESGFTFGKDFTVGYSPERINPGDKERTVDKIVKIVSGSDDKTLEKIARLYASVIKAGVYKAPSIKVAEAAKIIENTQRDINIALMNELKILFDKMGIDIKEIIKAASTKWNFLQFHPGLVGGHCIGVDPYYLADRAKREGLHPEMIIAGRRINDGMAKYHADKIIKMMIKKDIKIMGAKILILGSTFKPNVKDLRNSQIKPLILELKDYGCKVDVCDPVVSERNKIFECSNISLDNQLLDLYDFVVKGVKHKQFENLSVDYEI